MHCTATKEQDVWGAAGSGGQRWAAVGSGGQQLPAQLPAQSPLFPAACGSALHRSAMLLHSEPATSLTLMKTFCLLEEWMLFLLA